MAQQAKVLTAKHDHLGLRQEDHKLNASLGDLAVLCKINISGLEDW